LRLRSLFVVLLLSLAAAAVAASANGAIVCTPGDDVCVVTGGYAGLQSDIAASGASAPIVDLLTNEVALSQRLHPPSPCFVGHPPGPCTPAVRFLPSAYLLVLVDYQAATLAGILPGFANGSNLSQCSARLIDADVRAMFADQTTFPPGLASLAVIPPGPPC
jgi:hypothetical protein